MSFDDRVLRHNRSCFTFNTIIIIINQKSKRLFIEDGNAFVRCFLPTYNIVNIWLSLKLVANDFAFKNSYLFFVLFFVISDFVCWINLEVYTQFFSNHFCFYLTFFQISFIRNTSFVCWVTRMNVVRRLSSFSLDAPEYVHADRSPPRMSSIVWFTSPRYGISTVLPSLARYSATPPWCFCIAVAELIP